MTYQNRKCDLCGDTEDNPETHVCRDGAIYSYQSARHIGMTPEELIEYINKLIKGEMK